MSKLHATNGRRAIHTTLASAYTRSWPSADATSRLHTGWLENISATGYALAHIGWYPSRFWVRMTPLAETQKM